MKTHSIKFNFIMNAILTVSAVIFPMITFPYYSRVLGASGTGSVGFALAVVSYFTMIASLGVPTYGIRACAKVRDDKEQLSQTVQELLIINGATTVIMYIAFFMSLVYIPKFSGQKEILTVTSIAIVMNTMGVNWLYSALEKYSYITLCTMGFKVLGIIMMFALVHSPEDYIIYGGISAFASYGSGILNFINMRKYVSLKKTGPYDFRRHIKPILTFFLMSASISIYTNLDKVMLGFMKTNADVGYYDASVKIKSILVSVVTSLGTVLLPRMSFYIEKGENEAFKQTVTKAFRFVMVAAIGLMVFFIIFARESILLLSGKEYLPAVFPMQLLMVTLLLIGLSNITGIQILTPQGQEQKVLNSILAGAAVDFLLNMFLIQNYAATGAAFATVMAELVVLVVQCIYLRDMLKVLVKDIGFRKIVPAVIAAAGAALLLRIAINFETANYVAAFLTLALEAILFFGIYGGVLLLMKEPMVMEIWGMGMKVLRNRKSN